MREMIFGNTGGYIMVEPILNTERKQAVLDYLGVAQAAPSVALIDQLLTAYTQKVAWESASRIVRRANTGATEDCPRWPDEFWQTAIRLGTGGTCFESNLAFFALLRALDFEGYLTINNMGEQIGCHTAIVILIEGQKWLVDVGLPIYAALPLDETQPNSRETPLLNYRTVPIGDHRFEIERSPHPRPNAFTLIDRPMDAVPYREATTRDYGAGGLFLDKVVINKVVGGQAWRFNSSEQPLHLEQFVDGVRVDHALEGDWDAVGAMVGARFGIAPEIVQGALKVVAETSSEGV